MNEASNYFAELNAVDVGTHIEQKNGLSYLSWALAWGELKKRHPDAVYTVYENADGWNYHTDGRSCWVKTGVTVNGIEHIEMLPVMDFRNQSIPLEKVRSVDVNKTIQRSLTKAVARHGLGLYIYAGEDLPEESDGAGPAEEVKPAKAKKAKTTDPVEPAPAEEAFLPWERLFCAKCNKELEGTTGKDGRFLTAAELGTFSKSRYGAVYCAECMRALG